MCYSMGEEQHTCETADPQQVWSEVMQTLIESLYHQSQLGATESQAAHKKGSFICSVSSYDWGSGSLWNLVCFWGTLPCDD